MATTAQKETQADLVADEFKGHDDIEEEEDEDEGENEIQAGPSHKRRRSESDDVKGIPYNAARIFNDNPSALRWLWERPNHSVLVQKTNSSGSILLPLC